MSDPVERTRHDTGTDDEAFEPVRFTPGLFIDGDQRPVLELETTDAQAAFEAAVSADRLHLGWVMAGFDSAEVEVKTQREYRVMAYRMVTSEVGPLHLPQTTDEAPDA